MQWQQKGWTRKDKKFLRERRSSLVEDEDFLITDESEIAQQEARNGLLQFGYVVRLIEQYAESKRLELTPAILSELQRLSVQHIRRSAGRVRTAPVAILNTWHEPPPYQRVCPD